MSITPTRVLDFDPRRMTYGQMRRAASHLDVRIYSDRLPEDMDGVYDFAENNILIDRESPYTEKRCALVHELIHWQYGDDWHDAVLYERAECRTRRLTASMLIDPSEYAMLERMYDADRANIANGLNVTETVIKDFQTLVLRGECP